MDGVELRRRRKELGLSQAALASQLGLSRDFIGQMERGRAQIAPRTALAVTALGGESIADPGPLRTRDPMERIVELGLRRRNIPFETDQDGGTASGLDFYLPLEGIAIEVKRFHSPRIAEQMSREKNVIAIQGEEAARFFQRILSDVGYPG